MMGCSPVAPLRFKTTLSQSLVTEAEVAAGDSDVRRTSQST